MSVVVGQAISVAQLNKAIEVCHTMHGSSVFLCGTTAKINSFIMNQLSVASSLISWIASYMKLLHCSLNGSHLQQATCTTSGIGTDSAFVLTYFVYWLVYLSRKFLASHFQATSY